MSGASTEHFSPLSLVAPFGFLVGGAALAARPLREFDLPWHLAYGRTIAQTWTIPRIDDFAYTHTPVRYLGPLGDLLLYGVAHSFGPLGLQIVSGVVACTLAWVLVATASKQPAPSVLMAALAVAGAGSWLFTRPATLTFLLAAVVMLLIDRHRTAPHSPGGRMALIGAALVHAPWANIHGGAVLGVGLLGLYAGHRAASSRFSSTQLSCVFPDRDANHARFAAGATVLAAGACMLQPFGLSYFMGPLEVGRERALLGEWAQTSLNFFVHNEPVAALTLLAFLTAIALGRTHSRRSIAGFDLAVTLLGIALCTRVRFVPVAIILLAPIAARRLAGVVPDRAPLRLAASLLVTSLGPALLITHDSPPRIGFDPLHFPVRAVDHIERSNFKGHVWNFWPYGGYLIWRLYPQHRVLIDGRIGFVHDPHTTAQIDLSAHDSSAFDDLDARYSFQWAICRATESERSCEPIVRSPRWTMTYVDDTTAIYVRKDGDNADLAAAGYRVLRHLTPMPMLLSKAIEGGSTVAAIIHDAQLAVAQDPQSSRAWFVAACGAIANRDAHALAAATTQLTQRLPPDHPAFSMIHLGARSVGLESQQ